MTPTNINPGTGAIRQNICQWEIWVVDWEHEDGTSKRRRALVISSTAFNAGSNEVWFAKISTKKHEVDHRLVIEKADAAFAGTGLTETSYFYLANARKIPRDKIIERKGRLPTFSALMTAIAIKKALKPLP